MIKTILFFSLLVISLTPYAQNVSADEEAYIKGKNLYKSGQFDAAMDALHPLTDKIGNPIAPYAGYYYALAAYRKGFEYIALDMANYIVINYPKWNKVDELRIWLEKFYLVDKNYAKAFEVVGKISDPGIRQLSESMFITRIDSLSDYSNLVDLHEKYPNNNLIARCLADRIIQQPVIIQDTKLLDSLVTQFNFDRKIYKTNIVKEGRKKAQYNIAILFPFMVDDIIPGQSGKSNQFIYDMYEGILIGSEQLRKEGIRLNIVAYDTYKSSAQTQKLIDSGELNGYDMIIGPLYSGPVKLISDFSYNHQMMVFNPLSTNSEITVNNPFTLLFMPTVERQATAAARYAGQALTSNKNYFIFYGNNSRDSLSAAIYESILQKDSFNLNFSHRITDTDTVNIYKLLTDKVKLKDLHLSQEDSLEFISHYDIDTTAISEAGKKIEDHEVFITHPDSIGHIYGASSNSLIATSIISGVETRGDHMSIIGNEDWIDVQQLSLDQLKRLDIVLTAPGYINIDNPSISQVNNLIIKNVHEPPDKYHYLGYEMISYIGHMFYKYGSPFINGLKKEGYTKGIIYYGFDYSNGNDNNLVPMIKFIDNNFSIVNNPETDFEEAASP
jgi:hypothetical protein